MNNKAVDIIERQIIRGRILNICYGIQPIGGSMETLTSLIKKEFNNIKRDDIIEAYCLMLYKTFSMLKNNPTEM